MIVSIAGAFVQVLACLGLGTAALSLGRWGLGLRGITLVGTAAMLGIGILGWLMFFLGLLGWIQPEIVWPLLLVSCCPALLLRRQAGILQVKPFTTVEKIIIVMLLFVAFGNITEAISPPTDADSLAYHFALPKLFLEAGKIFFVPRAVDGAVPLLLQMTSLSARAVGGELGMTLWAAASFWIVSFLFYSTCRQMMARRFALAMTVVLMTVPAVVYGAVTGQVEIRMAGFVILAATAAARHRREGDLSHAALAGLAAGFLAGSKYTGLLFVPAIVLPLLLSSKPWRGVVVYGAAAAIAGFQWYFWNFWNTGDPVFPMAYGLLSAPAEIWTPEHDVFYRATWNGNELAVPQTFVWFLAYPFVAILDPPLAFEATRNGFGPFLWLALPMICVALWHARARILHHPLFSHWLVFTSFAALWFFLGSSQRVRFFVPVLPLALLGAGVCLARLAEFSKRGPVAGVFGVTLALHAAAFALYHGRYVEFCFGTTTRDGFVASNVTAFDAVTWLNRNVSSGNVLTTTRQSNYYLDVPYFYAHPHLQAQVEIRPGMSDYLKFYRQAHRVGVRYLLSIDEPDITRMGDELMRIGCANLAVQLPVQALTSRTFRWTDTPKLTARIYRLSDDERCGDER